MGVSRPSFMTAGFFVGFSLSRKRKSPDLSGLGLHLRCRIITGGERGIRTLGTLLTYTRFPGVLLQPLGHLSAEKIIYI